MRKKMMLLLAMLFIGIGMATAQNLNITGVVLAEEDNEPVIGASILVNGTSIGTITDFDGKFTLNNVPASAKTLTVSYVGMQTQEVHIHHTLKIFLKSDAELLDEVVVTAMGIKRDRKALGYAAQDLKADQLNKAGTTSLASAMQGKLTGVDIRQTSGAPGASAQIVIRGARSFDGNNQPLYVIDGMPINTQSDFSTGNSVSGANIADRSIDINPEDIETINVLKGQAASALYGIRASNGVIVITTKRGAKNGLNRPQITISTNMSADVNSRKFERQEVYAQGNSVNAYNPTSSMNWGPKITDLPNDPTYGGNVANSYTANGLKQGMYYNPKRAAAGLDGWTTPQIYDNVGDFLTPGFTENANFNISQAKDNVNYSFGLNNSYQNGIVNSTGMDRIGARGLVDWKIDNQWTTGFSANYSTSEITSAPGANSGIMNVVYSAPSEYDLKGIPFHAPGDPTQQILFRNPSFNNPYWFAENDEFRQHNNRLFGNAYVEFTPNLGWGDNMTLKFREQAGIDMSTSNYTDIAEVGSAYNKKGEITNRGKQYHTFNNLFTVNFDGKFGADQEWGLNVVLGNEFDHTNIRYHSYLGTNFSFYGFPTIANASSISGYEYQAHKRTVGFFGSASASWKDQLYLTVTGRNDYVSSMPRGSRSFFYPSVSLGWEFTKLHALEGNNILNYGKLRASWAQVGQAGDYVESFYSTPNYGGGMYLFTPIAYPMAGVNAFTPYPVLNDANLKPQNTTNYEVGVDLQLFNHRLKVEYTYSFQNVKDQIFEVPTDGSTGYQAMLTNAGKMRTEAHELSINAAILQAKDYDLNFGVNFTKINNKVVELAPGVESIMLGGFVEPQIRAQAGCTYPNIYGVKIKRNEKGEMILLDGLPQATGDAFDLGNCSPDFTTGVTLGGRYKRLSLNTTWNWNQGGKIYHGTMLTMNYFGATKESLPYHEGTMIAEGIDEATGEKNAVEVSKQDYFMALNDITESGIYDNSYVKLRDLTLTYQLPKMGRFDISVYGFARNVLIWANLPDFDPESSQGNTNIAGYFERFSLPNTSNFGGGFTVKF